MHAFISSRVDYCNGVFKHVSAVYLHPLQSVLNASARLIARKRKYDHITAELRDVLLPVEFRIEYKLCLLVYKSLHQFAPADLSEFITSVPGVDSDQLHLRFAARSDIIVPRTRTSRYGPRSFAVSCRHSNCSPVLWRNLSQ